VLTVTERAAQELKQVLDSAPHEEGQCLRLITDAQGAFRLTLDHEREGDQVVRLGEEAVLLIDPVLSAGLDGVTLDTEETPQGPMLVLTR